MKHITIIMVFFILIIYFTLSIANAMPMLKPNGKAYMFGDDVNVRGVPGLGNIIASVKIGDPIVILEKTNKIHIVQDSIDYWYKVKVHNKIGYIWGSLIADHQFRIDDNKQILILNHSDCIKADPMTYRKEYDNRFKLKNGIYDLRKVFLRYVVNGKIVYMDKDLMDGKGCGIDKISYNKYDGFNGKLSLLTISYSTYHYEYNGEGKRFYYISNNIMKEVLEINSSNGELGKSSQYIIFPSDTHGIQNTVIIEMHSELYINGRNEEPTKSKDRIYYQWESKLLKLKRIDKY